jgi:hypothetical protein
MLLRWHHGWTLVVLLLQGSGTLATGTQQVLPVCFTQPQHQLHFSGRWLARQTPVRP